jgi:uncharacterized membrane protein
MIKMGIPQWLIIAIAFMDFGFSIAKHGEYKDGKYNLWITLISNIITLYILSCGGFFK